MSEAVAADVPLETEANKLASYYSKLAEEKAVSPKLKEACLLYVEAEEQLEEQLVEEAIAKATKALEAFREAKNGFGQQDAVRLLCAGERLKQAPDFAIDKINGELRSCRESEDKRGQGCMLVGLAEAQLAKALAGEALSNLEEALPLLRAAGDQRLEALGALLSCRAQLSRVPRDAARSAEAGLGLYTELGDVVGQGKAQAWLARAHMEAQKPREALEAAMACADLAQSAKAQGEAMCLVASVHAFREKSRPAVQYAERGLAAFRKARCSGEGVALRLLVDSLVLRGELQRGLLESEGAQEDYETRGLKRHEAAAHGALAAVRKARQEWELAASELNQELDILKELGDRHGQLQALLALSGVYKSMKKASQAKEKAEEARQLADDVQDKKAEVLASLALVKAQVLDGKSEDAVATAQEALRCAKEAEDPRLEAMALQSLGEAHGAKGEAAAGQGKLTEAKAMLLELGDRRGAVAMMLALGELQMGTPEEAEASLEEAKEICKTLNYQKGMADVLLKLAKARRAKGEEQEAIKDALLAKKYCKAIEDGRGETEVLDFLASTSLQRGDKSSQQMQGKKEDSADAIRLNRRHRNSAHEAVKRVRMALIMARKNRDPYAEASAMVHLAHAQAVLNRCPEALNICRQAESIFRECGAVSQQASAVCLSAEVSNLMGNKPKAMETANRALELARRAEDGEVEGRVLGVMELIKGVQKQVQEIPEQMFVQDAGPQGQAMSAAAVPKGLDPVMVEQQLMQVVEQVAGGGEEVHLDTPLMESGLDSLSAVAFRNELSRKFQGVGTLPAALMFDYPSARAIAEHLVDRSKGLA